MQHPNKVGAIWTLLLAIVLAVSLSIPSTAFADDNSSSNDFWSDPIGTIASFFGVSGSQTREVSAASDSSTSTDYTWSLGNSTSTLYNGRVWTDKSVSAQEEVSFTGEVKETVQKGDSDFLVTYSALATSTLESGKSNVPVDVVFVIDNSNSMNKALNNSQTRLAATIDAVNSSIDTIMNSNPESRVAVVIYGLSPRTILPLGHYSSSTSYQHYGDYIWGSSDKDQNSTFGSVASDYGNISMTSSQRGTNTHRGVDAGFDILKSATNIGGGDTKHIPALILLSDGASTAAGSGDWWNPELENDGNGFSYSTRYDLKVAMNAQYNKQLVNSHYGVNDVDSDYACKVYTVGMGLDQLSNSEDGYGLNSRNHAEITLNPGAFLNESDSVSREFRNTWNIYSENRSANLDGYTFEHPDENDISTVVYNDGYYSANNADEVVNVFDDITSNIVTSTPQVPTKVEGNDPVKDGYITYTDYIGEYMEVDSVKELIWSGQVFKNPDKSDPDPNGDVTYTFTGGIDSPAYEGTQNANQIQITVHTDTAVDGTKAQTMTVKIPASAIPLRVNTIELNVDGEAESNTSNNAYPLRLVYGVSLQEGIDPDTLEGVSEEYIDENNENGKVNFYSNLYSGNQKEGITIGDVKVEFTPSDSNPFYFIQEDTPLYIDDQGNTQVNRGNYQATDTYYVPVTYYNGTTEETVYVARSASSFGDYLKWNDNDTSWTSWDDTAYVAAGAPRLGNIAQFIQNKSVNETDTAETSFYPTFEGTDVHDGKFVVYLGNNGKLQLDAPSSLTIAKKVTADSGLTAPDKTFTFDVTIAGKADTKGVKAILHTVDADDQEVTLNFDGNGKAQVVGSDETTSDIMLTAGQSLEIPGMSNTAYTVVEQNATNNAGFNLTQVEGAAQNDIDTATASGTVGAEDAMVTFTNNYSVSSVTTDELNINLDGTKTITGRDFQPGDSFTFTIAAGQATPNAPLPQKDGDNVTSAIINPTSGDSANFTFDGEITFDKPGEYRYIIRESEGSLAGIDYDGSIFRLNIVLVDNGDGTLRLANVNEIADLTTEDGMANDELGYTANPMVQKYDGTMQPADNNAVAFQNEYSAESATATIQGTKDLEITNSDYQLKENDFNFEITPLGSTTETKASYEAADFETDINQPMPTQTNVTNIANGNVSFRFGSGAFTQAMVGRTFGYQITESLGSAPDNTVMDSNLTRVVWVTVGDDSQGHVTATVAPNDGAAESPNNFTFTNTYKPTSTTIGGGDPNPEGITVKKTFTGHEWTSDYSFQYTISNISTPDGVTAPMPAETTITIGNPGSGTLNTNAFGAMTFEQEGTYIYAITETNGSHGGVTYDNHATTVTVEVTEDESTGILSAQVLYDNSAALNNDDKAVDDAAAFTNTYDATFDEGTIVNLNGTKNLTVSGNSDRKLGAGQFFFAVTPIDGAPIGDNVMQSGTSSYIVQNEADDEADNGVFSGAINGLLKNVKYQLSDLDGATSKDFVYLISEQTSTSSTITYDSAVYQVTVTVIDDGNGILSASAPRIIKGSMDNGSFVADEDQTGVNGVVFNNSYTPVPTDALATYPLKKVLSGNRNPGLQANEFNFTIKVSEGDASGVTLPANTTIGNAVDGTVNFGNITFTKAGTYKIKVTEVVPEEATKNDDGTFTLNHVTYDTHVVESTFSVTDQNGKLVVNRTGTIGSTTFTNTYEPDEVTTTDDTSVNTNILVTKKVTGAQATETFKFSLNLAEGQSGDNVYEGSGDSKTPFDGVEVTTSDNIGDGATETKAFSGVTFTAAGDYKFVIDETTTTEAGGWSYDDSTHEITVHVADQNGQLVITGIDDNNPTFTNSYKADPVDIGGDSGNAGIQVKKTLTGRDWQTGDTFTFTLTAQDNAPMPADVVEGSKSVTITNETDKTLDFGQITYDTEGTYTYNVKETVPTEGTLGGITYDSHEVTVTVTVTDTDHDGKLDVPTVSYNNSDGTTEADKSLTNAAAFTNTYGTVPGTEEKVDTEATFELTKQLTGIDWGDREFTFSITPADGTLAPMNVDGDEVTKVTVSAPADGDTANIDFGTFVYDKTGIYTYTIKEVVPEGATGNVYNGITYDTHEVTVTVNITDDLAGGFAHSVQITNGDTKFTNTYGTELNYNAAGGLQIEKTLIDHAIADDQFEFTITAQNNASKALLGNQDFKVLQTKASTDLDEQGNGVATLQVFDDVVFTHTHDQGDAPEYKFIIFENKGGDTNAGYTNDETQYTVTINVEDDGAGLLEVITHVVGGDMDQTYTSTNQGQQQTAIVPFTNTYEAMGTLGGEGAVKINATKTTTGRDMVAGEYNFTVTATNDNNEVKEYATGTNVAAADGVAGAVNFSAINYTKTSLNDDVQAGYADYDFIDGKDTYTYVYTVAEDTNGLASEGVTATASSFQITVVVTDNNDGKLSAQVAQYPDGSNSALAFANIYNTNSVDMTFVGAKQIDNGGWTDAPTLAQIAGEYTFTLSGVEEGTDNPAPLPADPTATNDATGNITFDPITYTLDNVFGAAETTDNETTEGVEAETTNENEGIETYAGGERSKTFTYTIEESGSVDGIQNDSAKTFTVTVTDDGSGKLTVDADQGTGALFTFTNTYNVPEESSSPTDGSLTLNKVLTGRDMAEGEFSFVMTGTSENAQGMSATGTNTAAVDGEAGSVTLSAITFQEPGTYEFQISEVNNNLGGIGYDGATLKAVANVLSDGKGNMEIGWTIYNADGTEISDYTYNNTYTASPTSVILGGTKVLDGRTLADGEFNFELHDADGNVLQTVANNAEGGIVFDKITYDAEGTYEYTISEVAGDAEGITYDDTTYTAKVVVTDDGQGSFKVSQLTYNDGVEFPLFTNTYTEPSAGEESDEGPIEYLTKTSDTWLPYFLGIIAAAAAAVVGISLRKIQSAHGAPRGRHGR